VLVPAPAAEPDDPADPVVWAIAVVAIAIDAISVMCLIIKLSFDEINTNKQSESVQRNK
jgi:hypothetical protein